MSKLMRRAALGAATLALSAGTLAGAVAPASAATRSTVALGSVATWHCRETLYAHFNQSGSSISFGASAYLRSYKTYQAYNDFYCGGYMEVSYNQGRTWTIDYSMWGLNGDWQHESTPVLNDNNRMHRACIKEWYGYYASYPNDYRSYYSGMRCTAGW